MKTVWNWETVYEKMVDIPAYDVYKFNTDSGDSFLVYRIVEEGKLEYYFQNVGYISAITSGDADKSRLQPVRILIIDANANGTYFDDEDMILFNSWNPYARNSSYQEVERFLDNFWYRLGYLKTEN